MYIHSVLRIPLPPYIPAYRPNSVIVSGFLSLCIVWLLILIRLQSLPIYATILIYFYYQSTALLSYFRFMSHLKQNYFVIFQHRIWHTYSSDCLVITRAEGERLSEWVQKENCRNQKPNKLCYVLFRNEYHSTEKKTRIVLIGICLYLTIPRMESNNDTMKNIDNTSAPCWCPSHR